MEIPKEAIDAHGMVKIGGGSGFIVDKSGIVLTNKHVVYDPDAEYTAVLSDERELPAKVICEVAPFIEIWSFPYLKGIEKNLALKDVYSTMETLLRKFDGCYFDWTDMNYSIKTSLIKEKLVVGPNEHVNLSNEREFVFPVRLDGLSRIFIAFQILFVGLPIVLLVPKPIIKFISKGRNFFTPIR